VIFCAIYYYQVNKKKLFLAGAVLALAILVMSPFLKLQYYDVLEAQQGERPVEEAGSGRPIIWAHNLDEFSKASPDRWIAGVGIGNVTKEVYSVRLNGESFWSSHNEYLAVLIHTGVLGLFIYFGLQLVILRRILAIEGPEKAAFLALFLAVAAMNFGSNSFLSRFALAQLYFLLISYLELNHRGPGRSHAQQLREGSHPS
jgi:O-antigen ligase